MSVRIMRGTCLAICVVTAAVANAATIPYTANTTVSDPLPLTEDMTIEVASGKTVVYDANAVISGGYALTKTGAGKLILAGANTFTEGVTISEGSLMASNSLALGTGDVTILGQRDGYSGVCQLELVGAGKGETFVNTFPNNVNVTGTSTMSYPALVAYGQKSVLSGDINASADFAYLDDDASTKAISSAYSSRYTILCLTFSGDITVAGTMMTDGWASFKYTGAVTAGAFVHISQSRAGGGGNATQRNANHDFFGPVTVYGDFINMKHAFTFDDGLTVGGAMRWNAYLTDSGTGWAYLGYVTMGSGKSITAGALDNDQTLAIVRYHQVYDGWMFNRKATGNAKTLTLRGPDRTGQTPTNAVSYMRFNNNLSIEVDAYKGFTQTFDGNAAGVMTNTMSGTLAATCGAIKIGSLAIFPNVPSITVGENGVFSNESAQALSLESVKTLTVDGVFASSTIPFVNDGTVAMSIGANGSVSFPEDSTITLDTLTINGVLQPPRTYAKGSLAQVHGVNLLVLNGAESATATWDGDGNVNEPSNWEGDSLPELTQFVTVPTFAASGTHSDINTDVQFSGISFAAPSGTDGFELRGAGGGIQVGAGGLLLDGTNLETARRYTISAPLDAIASQTWSVPSNQTLVIDNALTNINGTVTVEGARGRIELKGTNTFAGALVSTATVFEVSGLVATPGHVSQGAAAENGANTMMVLGAYKIGNNFYNNGGNLYVSNAIIEKPLYINYSGDGGIVSRAGTTNVFMGNIRWPLIGMSFVVAKNSELVFRGGFTTGWSFRPNGEDLSAVMRICDTPVTATASTGWNISRGKLSIEVPGNTIKILSTGGTADQASSYTNILLNLAVSYAFNDAQDVALMNGYYFSNGTSKMMLKEKGYAEIDLNDTTQRVATLCGSSVAKFKGEYPATIEVLKQREIPGNTAGSVPFVNAADMFLASKIEGNVTIAMYGTANPLLLTNRVFESYGDIIVTNGTMEFAADASWPNGTNVTVSGNGLLKIGQSGTFGKQAVLRFADDGRMYIPEGVEQTFAEGWDGDRPLKGGRSYDATTLPGRITGGGSIYIRRQRFVIILY